MAPRLWVVVSMHAVVIIAVGPQAVVKGEDEIRLGGLLHGGTDLGVVALAHRVFIQGVHLRSCDATGPGCLQLAVERHHLKALLRKTHRAQPAKP